MISSRRSFLVGIGASLIAAPAVVKAASLMPVRGIVQDVRQPPWKPMWRGYYDDERILMEARLRFRRCKEHQGKADTRFLEDTKFANADARNGWQWPETIWQERTGNDKPTLTINKSVRRTSGACGLTGSPSSGGLISSGLTRGN